MQKILKTCVFLFAATIGCNGVVSANQGDTLETVQKRGALNCTSGEGNYEGFFEVDAKGQWHGLDIDYCRAVATAIFGNDKQLKLIPVSWAQRFPSLQSGDLDLVIKATGWTMSRDTELGLQFSMPYFVGETTFMAHKSLNAQSVADLVGGTVCISGGTSTEKLVIDYLERKKYDIKVQTFEKNADAAAAYFSGRCDAFSDWAPALAAARAGSSNPIEHVILSDSLALEPEAIAMRQGDDAWVDLANWVIAALIIAEENGITSTNVDAQKAKPANNTVAKLLGVTPGIGTRLGLKDDWAYNVIKTVGNSAEIYNRNIGDQSRYKLPRGANALRKQGGIFYAPVLD